MAHKIAAVITLGLLAACTTPPPLDKSPPAAETTFHPLTTPVILVGDTQEHHVGGLPVASIVNGPIDKVIDVTIRPPQQSLFGRTLMRSIVLKNPQTPLIHLGDLLDISCREEWNRISPMLMKPNIVMAHGNHDGIAHGIFNDIQTEAPRTPYVYSVTGWKYECFNPVTYKGLVPEKKQSPQNNLTEIFTSSDFIEQYSRYKTGAAKLPYREEFIYKTASQPEEIVGRLEPESDCINQKKCSKYTVSYLLQKVRLPAAGQQPVAVLLLDTSQYAGSTLLKWPRRASNKGLLKDTVKVGKENPGSMGHLQDDQLAQVARLVAEAPKDEILLFAGHHDWLNLSAESQKRLSTIFSTRGNQPLIYFSAHTHTGFMQKHALADGRTLTEINTNSLADWPVSLREMSLAINEDRSVIRVTSKIRLDSLLEPESTEQHLAKRWENACIDTGAISQESFDAHTRIAVAHRHNSQSLLNLALFAFEYRRNRNSPSSKNLLYEDKLNDLQYAKSSIVQTMNDLPGYRSRLEQYLSTDKKSICYKQPLNQCISQTLDLPTWKYLLRDYRTEGPKHYYLKLSELYSAAQKAVDETSAANEVAYMKCAFIAAAISDNNSIRRYKGRLSANAPSDFYLETINAPMRSSGPTPR